jgi:hypothetical protein
VIDNREQLLGHLQAAASLGPAGSPLGQLLGPNPSAPK